MSLIVLIAACETVPPVTDSGHGKWIREQDAPAIDYAAVWGTGRGEVYAVGDGGVAAFDGKGWSAVDGVPDTEYRAVWGRSPTEVWIGGDDVLLAWSDGGWQEQTLWHDQFPIDDYAVLAIVGDALHEYAIVRTGAKLLLLVNEGAAWDTPLWSVGEPRAPIPQQPSAAVSWSRMLVAGDSNLIVLRTNSSLGVPSWESYSLAADTRLPPLAAIAARDGTWAAAGGRTVVLADELDELSIDVDPDRDAHGLSFGSPGQVFVVGGPIERSALDPASGVKASPIEACDAIGCALERVSPGDEHTPLRAVWSEPDGTAFAAGNRVILRRDNR